MFTTRGCARTLVVVAATFASSSTLAKWNVTRLHTPPMVSSSADALSANAIGGSANFGESTHATAWLGFSADSWVDLHPLGFQASFVTGVSSGQQVGNALAGNGDSHAGYWTGTAASWVELNPIDASSAWVNCSDG